MAGNHQKLFSRDVNDPAAVAVDLLCDVIGQGSVGNNDMHLIQMAEGVGQAFVDLGGVQKKDDQASLFHNNTLQFAFTVVTAGESALQGKAGGREEGDINVHIGKENVHV